LAKTILGELEAMAETLGECCRRRRNWGNEERRIQRSLFIGGGKVGVRSGAAKAEQ
jgi:hypothetical protein